MIRDREGRTLEEFLAAYDPKKYDQPSITVDMVVFMPRDGRLTALLIKRGNHPFLGESALPGGFMNMDETLEEALPGSWWRRRALRTWRFTLWAGLTVWIGTPGAGS